MRKGAFFQIQAMCKHGCDQHLPGEWRKSKDLHDVSLENLDEAIIEAERQMVEHAREFWRSSPFRLVVIEPPLILGEVVTVYKTMETFPV